MPVRLASSPNGHGFAALWVEFPRTPSERSKTNGYKPACAGLEPFVLDRPVIVSPYFRNRLSLSMKQIQSFQIIVYYNHRKIRNWDSIKTKVLGEEGVGANRAGSFWGGGEPWGAPLPNLKTSLLPLSTHSAASWRRRGRGSASYREERFPARRRCRSWDDR